jgi:hypothetical protein
VTLPRDVADELLADYLEDLEPDDYADGFDQGFDAGFWMHGRFHDCALDYEDHLTAGVPRVVRVTLRAGEEPVL